MTGVTTIRLAGLTLMLISLLLAGCSDGDGFSGQRSRTATIEVDGQINWLNNGARDVGYVIDQTGFSVVSSGLVTVDVLSAASLTPSLDAQIYLLWDDGIPDVNDVLYVNDDGEPGADGSLLELDSYLQMELAPGDYLLYVSACCFSADEALAGYRLVTGNDPLPALEVGGINGLYRVTITGDVVRN